MDSDRGWCSGQLKGDPDVAGIGVTTTTFLTTSLSIIFSWVLWYLIYISTGTKDKGVRYAVGLKCAFVFADIQLASALALICSSLIHMLSEEGTSLYHIFITRSLVQANMVGQGASLICDVKKQLNWQIRIGLTGMLLALYIVWTSLAIKEFRDTWSYTTPKCFYNDNIVQGEYEQWMIAEIPWTLVGNIWLIGEATGICKKALRWSNRLTTRLWSDAMYEIICFKQTLFAQGLATALLQLFQSFGRLLMLAIMIIIGGPPCVAPMSGMLFLTWNMYDVYTARASNRELLVVLPIDQASTTLQGNTNPEDDWGFGQLLPLFLLMLPLLQFADAWVEESRKEQKDRGLELARKAFNNDDEEEDEVEVDIEAEEAHLPVSTSELVQALGQSTGQNIPGGQGIRARSELSRANTSVDRS